MSHPRFGLLFALALSACGYRANRECVSERGCPDPAPLPPCATQPASPAAPHALTQDHTPPLDRDVRLEGLLEMGPAHCTLLYCGGDCCNGCGAVIRLRDPLTSVAVDLDPSEPRWTCGGDDSGLCCNVAVGQYAAVEGRFVSRGESIHGPVHAFQVARACALPSPAP